MTDHNRETYRGHDWREADRLRRNEQRVGKFVFFLAAVGAGFLAWEMLIMVGRL